MCECSDRGCKAHEGESVCESVGTIFLYRIDMTDETGTLFCEDCASDAMESGLFTDEPENISTRELDINSTCPVCDGNSYPLGVLGRRTFYRCQDCGMEFS